MYVIFISCYIEVCKVTSVEFMLSIDFLASRKNELLFE